MSGFGDDVFVFVLEIGAVPQHGFIICLPHSDSLGFVAKLKIEQVLSRKMLPQRFIFP